MNKQEFIKLMAKEVGETQVMAEKNFEAFWKVLIENIKKAEKISFLGYGNFTVKQRAAIKTKSFFNKEEVTIPAYKIVKFKQGKKLREAVRED